MVTSVAIIVLLFGYCNHLHLSVSEDNSRKFHYQIHQKNRLKSFHKKKICRYLFSSESKLNNTIKWQNDRQNKERGGTAILIRGTATLRKDIKYDFIKLTNNAQITN